MRAGGIAMAVVLAGAARVDAQSAPKPAVDTSALLPRTALEDLPSSGGSGGLLETTIPLLISDRIDAGGLGVASFTRLGARGSSWTQTGMSFDETDFTDPGLFGSSLLFLDPMFLGEVELTTEMVAIERPAPGLAIRLIPMPPTEHWRTRAEFFSTPSAAAPSQEPVPPIATLRARQRLAGSVSGPLRTGLSAMLGVAVNTSTRFERADATELPASDTNAFAQLRWTPSEVDEVFGALATRSSRGPFGGRAWIGQPDARQRFSDLMIESHWKHDARRITWTAAGGFRRATFDAESAPPPVAYIDSIADVPIQQAVSEFSSRHQWSAAVRARGASSDGNRWLRGGRAGLEVAEATSTNDALLASTIAETVEGIPARLWEFTNSPWRARHRSTTGAAYVAETIPLGSHGSLDAGVRWEGLGASADRGDSIGWSDWFPRLSVRWDLLGHPRLTGFLGLGRYGYRLPLELLAYGDPAAPGASVFRWIDRNGDGQFSNAEKGPLVARVGDLPPGTSSIDSHLKRPYLDELVVGLELRPTSRWIVRLAGVTRQDRRLIAPLNTGVPLTAYDVTMIPDAGEDFIDSSDDRLLPVYNRPPGTFGADRYLLTNPAKLTSTYNGLDLEMSCSTDRLWLAAGATAGQSSGLASARGFQVFENDSGSSGDFLVDPNASTYARGSFFSDRNYTIKASGVYRFPYRVTLGAIARYQDGQPFSRLVLAEDLDQGPEAIRAYRNGRTRFTYLLTVDTRAQLSVGKSHASLVWDIFNLFGMANEVEESVVTGPAFRTTTAVQPGRVMHVGLRVAF